jgi:hypothetical protein
MIPAKILLEQLAAARRAGCTFEDAWQEAFAVAVAAAPNRDERREWASVLGGMVEVWRSAWERRPASAPEVALRVVAEDSDREPLPERECAHCGQEVPDERGRRGAPARYCSPRCCHAASERRRAVAA